MDVESLDASQSYSNRQQTSSAVHPPSAAARKASAKDWKKWTGLANEPGRNLNERVGRVAEVALPRELLDEVFDVEGFLLLDVFLQNRSHPDDAAAEKTH